MTDPSAVDDEEEAVLVDVAEIAGVKPAVAEGLSGRLLAAEVALHDVEAADHDLADVILAGGQRPVSVVRIRTSTPQIGFPTL